MVIRLIMQLTYSGDISGDRHSQSANRTGKGHFVGPLDFDRRLSASRSNVELTESIVPNHLVAKMLHLGNEQLHPSACECRTFSDLPVSWVSRIWRQAYIKIGGCELADTNSLSDSILLLPLCRASNITLSLQLRSHLLRPPG
jgi:hypothetical protein